MLNVLNSNKKGNSFFVFHVMHRINNTFIIRAHHSSCFVNYIFKWTTQQLFTDFYLFLHSSWAMSSLFCLFTSKLMLRLGITWKTHNITGACWALCLVSAKLYVYVYSVNCAWENKVLLTHSCAVSLCQPGGIAGDQFVLFILPAGTVNTTDTHREQRNQQLTDSNINWWSFIFSWSVKYSYAVWMCSMTPVSSCIWKMGAYIMLPLCTQG